MINILYLHAGAEMYGADKVLLELVKGLDKTIYNPIVVLPCDGVLVEKLRENNITVEVMEYPILRRKYFNLKGIINYASNYFSSCFKLRKIIKEKNIDIIHVNTFAVLQGLLLKVTTNAKFVWHIHEIIKSPAILNKVLSKLASIFADETIVVSKAVKEHLIREANFKNIKVIYNGVDNLIYNPDNEIDYLRKEFNIPQSSRIIGMIGRVNSWKGQNDFLDAVIPILEKDSSLVAILVGGVFAGEEWRINKLEKRIAQLENSDQFRLIPFRDDPQNFHNLFDIFVLPSTNPDPLPTVVLEAMATGKPVIGYRHGGVCEMVKENENGLLCTPCEPSELSNCIQTVLYDESLLKMFSENSLYRQKNLFSLNSYITNFSNVYSNLKGERHE